MDGSLEQHEGGWRIVFSRRLPHAPEKVWRALTEPEQLRAWFPTTIEGERRAGAPLRFGFDEDRFPAFDGEMLAFDPPRLMELMWGPDRLRFELRPEDGATVLTLEDAVDDLGKAARDGAGWHVCLDKLGRSLAGEPPLDDPEDWRKVHPGYVAAFGPQAATIGPPEGHPVLE